MCIYSGMNNKCYPKYIALNPLPPRPLDKYSPPPRLRQASPTSMEHIPALLTVQYESNNEGSHSGD